MEALKKCLNPKVLLGLAVVAIGVAIFAPKALAAALPLLLIAACPLSMIFMMGMMGKGHKGGNKQQESLTILKKRYAKGEISDADYERMKKEIQA